LGGGVGGCGFWWVFLRGGRTQRPPDVLKEVMMLFKAHTIFTE